MRTGSAIDPVKQSGRPAQRVQEYVCPVTQPFYSTSATTLHIPVTTRHRSSPIHPLAPTISRPHPPQSKAHGHAPSFTTLRPRRPATLLPIRHAKHHLFHAPPLPSKPGHRPSFAPEFSTIPTHLHTLRRPPRYPSLVHFATIHPIRPCVHPPFGTISTHTGTCRQPKFSLSCRPNIKYRIPHRKWNTHSPHS